VNYEREKKYFMSYCGSYCRLCDWHTGKIKRTFIRAAGMVDEFGFAKLFKNDVDRENLMLGISRITGSSICSGCKMEIRDDPEEDRCQIRQCCASKGYDLCSECDDFPCELLTSNPGVIKFGCIENLREIKDKGFAKWLDEQWYKYLRE